MENLRMRQKKTAKKCFKQKNHKYPLKTLIDTDIMKSSNVEIRGKQL